MSLNSFQTSGSSPTPARCHVGSIVGSATARRLTGPDSLPNLHLTPICQRRARETRARQSEPRIISGLTDQTVASIREAV